MEEIDPTRVAETILAAPGWARVGITAPTSSIRTEAAYELARVIIAEVAQSRAAGPDPEQLGLSL